MMCRRLALLVLMALITLPAAAQEQTGSIQGVIKDAQGAVMPGATVEATATNQVGTITTVTDGEGRYRFPALPPGVYEVTASVAGFSPSKVTNVQLALGQLLKIDMTLAIASVTEAVQVTAESPLIDVKQNANSTSLTQSAIERIPKGRDFTGVIAMQPGSNDESRAGGISIDGASGSENRFIVDGVDTTNLQNGTSGKRVVSDFIGEVQVKTSGYAAEYPGATGGVVSAITKSGTNGFRGSAGFYFTNNESLKGKARPSIRLKPTNTTQAEYVTAPLDTIPTWEPVFELSGPILRDKLWFYGGYAPVRQETTRDVHFTAKPTSGASQDQTFKQNDKTDNLTVHVSSQLRNNVRVKFTYAPTWGRTRGSLPSNSNTTIMGDSSSSPDVDYLSSGSNTWNSSYAGGLDWTAAQNWFVNISGGYFSYDRESLGNGTEIRSSFANENTMFPEIPASLRNISGFITGKSSSKTVKDLQGRYMLNATSTHYLQAKGEHTFKAGLRFERIFNDRFSGNIQPTITFSWDQPYVTSSGASARGKYGYYSVSNSVIATGDVHSDNWGFFLQDSWAPASRVSINAGVRVESEKVPFYSPGSSGNAISFGFGDKIAPRVGFAWDVAGDSRWKVYGSFGRYFDITKLEMPRGSLGGESWLIDYYTLDTFDWPTISCQQINLGGGCPGTPIETARLRFGSNEIDPETAAVTTKYFGKPRNLLMDGMKPVQSQEAIAGVEHELSPVMSVTARYVHKWVTRTIEDFGWNEGGTEYYIIGNPGEGPMGSLQFLWGPGKLYTTGTPVYEPKPVRDYDAVEFTLKKRLSKNWSGQVLYQWSRLWGNFPGLASSDEGGRNSPNVNRMYDGLWMGFDDSGSGKPVMGLLNTDRPHLLKAQATYDFRWGLGIGANFYARTGALYSKQLSYQGYSPTFYEGRGSLGRTPVEQALDLLVQQDFKIGRNQRINLSLNVANVFDNDVATALFASPYRDRLTLSPVESFFNGFDTEALFAAKSSACGSCRPDARYKQASSFLGRRDIRLGMRFSF